MRDSNISHPFYIKPILMERVWGGNRLGTLFGNLIPDGRVIGESWELSDRPEAQSIVLGGPFDGKTVRYLLENHSEALLGPELAAVKPSRFPLLAKFVDAGSALSIQVHPDDIGARSFNDRGKAECWVVVHAEQGARLTRGLLPGTTRSDFEKAVAYDRVADMLHSFTPSVGDVIALPPGVVHAIGAGIVVAEIQQNSDTTLRIYDYNRLGLDGKPRQLHVLAALSAIRFGDLGNEFSGDMTADIVVPLECVKNNDVTVELLLKGRFFDLKRYTIRAGENYLLQPEPNVPRLLMTISGSGVLAGRELKAGQTVLIPAKAPALTIKAVDHANLVLLTSCPTLAAC